MLKHVHLSPYRSSMMSQSGRSDTMSLNSTMSCSSLSQEPLSSRSSSYTSLNESQAPTTTIKIYARCLRPDIEYKTLVISYGMTCKDLVVLLLNKAKMKHRDPKLFYLTMEVGIRKPGVPLRTILVLDDDSRPAELQSCYPRGCSRFALQMRRGGLVRVHDSVLMPNSQYKSLMISDRTTVDDLIELLLRCHNSTETSDRFSIYEVCSVPGFEYERKLHPDDCPLAVQTSWNSRAQSGATSSTDASTYHTLVVRRNVETVPIIARRRLPWSKSLDLSVASESGSSSASTSSAASTSSREGSLIARSSSYHDYENYFYI